MKEKKPVILTDPFPRTLELIFSKENFLFLKKNFNYGLISFLFLIFYGIFRIVSEFYREPDKHIGYMFDFISLGSLLSVGMIIFAILFILKIDLNEQNK